MCHADFPTTQGVYRLALDEGTVSIMPVKVVVKGVRKIWLLTRTLNHEVRSLAVNVREGGPLSWGVALDWLREHLDGFGFVAEYLNVSETDIQTISRERVAELLELIAVSFNTR